ncbi:ovochymase-2-like isoform X2 [Panonychus citri]|uniref:ovochymase-2-like isoform X2 n=1 Tax=Panonychus citri TaxID=50023 RepID=UPI00230811FB|nr:ovochymase-2-like isoform X2 [Panonychus citri]
MENFHLIQSTITNLSIVNEINNENDLIWNQLSYKENWPYNQSNHERKLIRRQNVASTCDCGLENWSDRIVGGSEVNPKHRYPWLIAIRFAGRSIICGGALIDSQYILTAAHCLVGLEANEIDILIGCHDVRRVDCKVHSVERIISHPNYSRRYHENDIGLIKLTNRVTYSSTVRPACLPSPSSSPAVSGSKNQPLIVAGWGYMEQGGLASDVLRHTTVNYVDKSTCRSSYPSSYITDKNFCASTINSDACQGDSGGPAMKRNQFNRIELTGIISFGRGCGNTDSPGVYTDVVKYLDWIAINSQFAGCFSSNSDDNTKEKMISGRCGLVKSKVRQTRVVGGQANPQINYPWTAAIGYKGQLIGAGTLIQSNLILTTASLIRPIIESHDYNVRQLLVILGAFDITQRENDRRSFQVSRVIIHPNHSLTNRYKNDYAILILSSSSEFTPICLPSADSPYPVNYNVRSLGWGRTTTSSGGSNSLRYVDLKLTDRSNCLQYYSNNLSNDQFCASGYNKGPCNGDEGGPLMIQFNQQYYLAGLYSHVHPNQPCGQQGSPSLFTDTRHGLDWIHKIMYSNQ